MSDIFALWLLKTLAACFVALALWEKLSRWMHKRDVRDGIEEEDGG